MFDRRRWLLGSMAMGIAPAIVQGIAACGVQPLQIIDAHTHFYDPTRPQGVPWPSKGFSLYRPVYPRDWKQVSDAHGVVSTIVVEASSWLEDNQWVLDLAKEEKSIVGFVGHLKTEEPDFEEHLRRFSANPIFRGIRIGGSLESLMTNSSFHRSLHLLVDFDRQLDVNVQAKGLKHVCDLAERHSHLRIVFDHAGGAGDPAHLTDDWKRDIAKLGRSRNVFCKISGLIEQTEQSRNQYGLAPREAGYYLPILDHCWDVFGEDRLIYGSNWPVCEKGGTYADQFQIVDTFFRARGERAHRKYFRENAETAYRCEKRV